MLFFRKSESFQREIDKMLKENDVLDKEVAEKINP